jgi:hypothetical protein
VFIVTRQQLTSQDGDEEADVYDARVDGGLQTSENPPCAGEACRPPVTPAPSIYGTPPSGTFFGAGNSMAPMQKIKPAPKRKAAVECAKGKKRSHGKCVKAKPHKKRKAKKTDRKGKTTNRNRRSK